MEPSSKRSRTRWRYSPTPRRAQLALAACRSAETGEIVDSGDADAVYRDDQLQPTCTPATQPACSRTPTHCWSASAMMTGTRQADGEAYECEPWPEEALLGADIDAVIICTGKLWVRVQRSAPRRPQARDVREADQRLRRRRDDCCMRRCRSRPDDLPSPPLRPRVHR